MFVKPILPYKYVCLLQVKPSKNGTLSAIVVFRKAIQYLHISLYITTRHLLNCILPSIHQPTSFPKPSPLQCSSQEPCGNKCFNQTNKIIIKKAIVVCLFADYSKWHAIPLVTLTTKWKKRCTQSHAQWPIQKRACPQVDWCCWRSWQFLSQRDVHMHNV